MKLIDILQQMKAVLEEELTRINTLIDREMLLEKSTSEKTPVLFLGIEEEEAIGRCI